MTPSSFVAVTAGLLAVSLVALIAFVRWAMRWGSTEGERQRAMRGDAYLWNDASVRVAMTRAVSIARRSRNVVTPRSNDAAGLHNLPEGTAIQ